MQGTEQETSPQVRIERRYPHAAEKVWRAWTEPQALSLWFGGMRPGSTGEAEVDLRVGGRYHIVSRVPGGETHDVSGEYLEVAPHRRLSFTWAWHSTPERVSRVSIDFTEVDGGTLMLFVHDRFYDDQARANHERGWVPGMDRLGDYLLQHDSQEV